ncbi:hypothetical protein PENSPDRAFT_648950 [Peniophora sp. CONT]|nr:hypothetical protein PENSPDRAFT_648950 [Peniophora sp. CONT]
MASLVESVANLDVNETPNEGQQTPRGEPAETLTCPVSGHAATDGAACPVAHANGTLPIPTMQEIDPEAIRLHLEDRMRYLKDFLGFGVKDQEIMKRIAPIVSETINETVERLYANLFEFDITKKVFMERNDGFDGELPERLEDLKLDSPQLVYRKIFMRTWCRRVLMADYTSGKTWAYMDKVGIMHTGVKSFKHRTTVSPLHVPYRDCALTLGWVQTVLHTALLGVPEAELSMAEKVEAIGALNKILWIQNDLFARHYIPNE